MCGNSILNEKTTGIVYSKPRVYYVSRWSDKERERERERQKSIRRLLDFMVRSYFYCRKQEIIICRCNYMLVMFSYWQTYFKSLIIKLLYYNCIFYIVQFDKNLNTFLSNASPFECLYEWRYINVRNITS